MHKTLTVAAHIYKWSHFYPSSSTLHTLLLSSRNPVLMTPLTERPLAAFTLWPAKQPSWEHIMEKACVSRCPFLVTLFAHTHSFTSSIHPSRPASLKQAGLDKLLGKHCTAEETGGLLSIWRDLISQINPVHLRAAAAWGPLGVNGHPRDSHSPKILIQQW